MTSEPDMKAIDIDPDFSSSMEERALKAHGHTALDMGFQPGPAFFEALAQAQGETPAPVCDQMGFSRATGTKYPYASLAAHRAAYKAPFAKHGFSILCLPVRDGKDGYKIVTILAHKSGERLILETPVIVEKDKQGRVGNQEVGSAITYQSRYAIRGVAQTWTVEEDDDGLDSYAKDGDSMKDTKASKPAAKPEPKSVTGPPPSPEETERARLLSELKRATHGKSADEAVVILLNASLAELGFKKLSDVPTDELRTLASQARDLVDGVFTP